jgi:KamA family protein
VHCRYCFRQNYGYGEEPRGPDRWDAVVRSIASDPSVREAILSGGDPLSLTDSVIHGMVERLSSVASLRTLRVHTRLPVAVPSRVTAALCDVLKGTRLRVAVVLHCNHPAELDAAVAGAVERLRDAGATLLNQSVLLRGVNDSVDTLESLSLALWEAGILPYYLHALDAVAGSSRFAVPDAEGARLCEVLRGRLPGYLVPRFVREIEGEPSKTPMG